MKKKAPAIIVFLLSIFLSAGCFQGATEPAFDIIITNGRLYDGSEAKPEIMDIGIKGDKIAAIGKFSGHAARTIDAAGLIVAPGFIDVHSRTDQMLKEKGLRRVIVYIKPSLNGNHNYLRQGVTTIVTGNCGRGYTKTAKWLGWVDSLKFGVNVHHLVPVGDVFLELFGSAALQPLNEKQKEIWQKRIIKEVENGAIGVSLDLSQKPGSLLTREELTAIGNAIKPYGGIFVLNLRNKSGVLDGNGTSPFIQSINEAVAIGRQTGVSIHLSNLELMAPRIKSNYRQYDSIIREARRTGVKITADQALYADKVELRPRLLPPEEDLSGNAVINESFARKLMADKFVFVSSDGLTSGEKVSQINPGYFGAFPRKLRKYALEDKIINVQDAIRSMTSGPAEKFGIAGRGRIIQGNFADIAIINLEKIKDKATSAQPEQYAEGIEYLIVNGVISIDQGRIATKKGGRPLRRF